MRPGSIPNSGQGRCQLRPVTQPGSGSEQGKLQSRPTGRFMGGHGAYRPPMGDGSDSAVLSGRLGATGFRESGIAEGSA